ncbi:carboxypeptidase regulatory-like domain-containing protein [Bisgaard Taxon 10/6]|uniref:Carboxypeptidase regulatory-like domain-containing protein n=1 Tax=Exercitatus varius TaxID=67857 RepID=A0AAW6QCJ7_9PAST|nr:carboxypeptidase regulatory-like domain-containing protein [Exercitatus varius]MDG2939896.1 carboxypeptidase regulatory-like domain-containing protein [Exercitatus varius]MDG2941731.1 carboxypeptidase regulatory-like domain-containing protein [Exercitatus varius]MDG2949954.1 carboxypeptidase regulatory-like domain-containing protein [Exercitatus varius]
MKTRIILTALLLSFAASVGAHGLSIFAQYDGTEISGKAYYSDQTPAAETYVEAVRTGETEPAVYGKTDKQGAFRLPIRENADFSVNIEGMEGHKATAKVNRIESAVNSGAVSNEAVLALREDINRLKDKLYFHDILGGIGYIFGLAGMVAWLRSRQSKGKD